MSIKIIKAGIADTIQDGGRYGYQHLGINPTGAMDRYALQVANAVVGNNLNEAVIELHFPASVFLFLQPALIAISGADFSVSINGEAVQHLHCIAVNKNDVLQFQHPLNGARAYLSVRGGFAIKKWLGSNSTNLKANAGGYNGSSLQKGDELLFNYSNSYSSILKRDDFKVLPWSADIKFEETAGEEIFVLPGNEWERLTDVSKNNFTTNPFSVAKQSDRMGYQLLNNPLKLMESHELVSTAVCFGTIQLLPDGKLVVLMADHQTTGGYPRIAHVITAHHHKLAQMKSGESIFFRITDQLTAENLLIKQQQHLIQLQNACNFKLNEYLKNE